MTVGCVQQCAGRANLNAVTALRTIQPTAVRANHGVGAAIAGFDRFFAHPFVADARATLAENAALRIVGDHRRKISLRLGVLTFDESLFEIAPVESQLLQLALATAIADRTIKRMIRQQEFEHRTLRFLNFLTLRRDHHAVRADDRARGLQLGHLLDAYQAHATRGLQSEISVVAERRNVETVVATNIY